MENYTFQRHNTKLMVQMIVLFILCLAVGYCTNQIEDQQKQLTTKTEGRK